MKAEEKVLEKWKSLKVKIEEKEKEKTEGGERK